LESSIVFGVARSIETRTATSPTRVTALYVPLETAWSLESPDSSRSSAAAAAARSIARSTWLIETGLFVLEYSRTARAMAAMVETALVACILC
jgi:hypothetical protein